MDLLSKNLDNFRSQQKFNQEYYKRIGIQQLNTPFKSLNDIQDISDASQKVENILSNLAKKDIQDNGFEEVKYIAKGGQGRVFLAKCVQSKIRYALKCYELGKEEDLIEVEIKTMQLFKDSPNVVKYFNHFKGEHFICIQMQECRGDLNDLLKQEKQEYGPNLNENTVIKLATEIFYGIMEVHSKDIIICDLKPENILIDYHGRALISDFDLAKVLKQNQSKATQPQGNQFYRAPEAILTNFDKYKQLGIDQPVDKLSKRADLFSFALLIYRMISNENTLLERFVHQKYDIDASYYLQTFKYKENFQKLIMNLTNFIPNDRLNHIQVFSMLHQMYSQEIGIDNYKFNQSLITNQLHIPDEISDIISLNSNYVIPIFKKKNIQSLLNNLTQINNVMSVEELKSYLLNLNLIDDKQRLFELNKILLNQFNIDKSLEDLIKIMKEKPQIHEKGFFLDKVYGYYSGDEALNENIEEKYQQVWFHGKTNGQKIYEYICYFEEQAKGKFKEEEENEYLYDNQQLEKLKLFIQFLQNSTSTNDQLQIN